MTRRQRAAAAIGTIAIAVGSLAYATGILAGDMCVQQFENPGQGGDSLTVCSTTPTNVKIPNLSTRTDNLVNGCQRISNVSSTWNDCISSARVAALPSNQRVSWYRDASYTGTRLHCVDTNGSYDVTLPGGAIDLISSFRVESGNCP